jgi:putative ABC transport system substrate-binding protein
MMVRVIVSSTMYAMKRAAAPSILVAVVLLAVAVIAEAQQPTKVPRLGYLSSVDPASESTRAEPFRLGLRELGYIEGQNIAIEYRYAEGKWDRLPELAGELGLGKALSFVQAVSARL